MPVPSSSAPSVPVLGIVGGIGSGKSYVASLFAKRGALVLDADQFGHLALKQPAILSQVQARWGTAVLDKLGQVDRKKLGALVFHHAHDKQHLEALVFPFIKQSIENGIATAAQDNQIKLVILDAAILLETGWRATCQALVYVDASEPVRLKRVAHRGWDAAELRRRESTQWPLEQKKAACQHVIPNQGDEVLTESLVNELYSLYARQ